VNVAIWEICITLKYVLMTYASFCISFYILFYGVALEIVTRSVTLANLIVFISGPSHLSYLGLKN
jgi:hypothetical protein